MKTFHLLFIQMSLMNCKNFFKTIRKQIKKCQHLNHHKRNYIRFTNKLKTRLTLIHFINIIAGTQLHSVLLHHAYKLMTTTQMKQISR